MDDCPSTSNSFGQIGSFLIFLEDTLSCKWLPTARNLRAHYWNCTLPVFGETESRDIVRQHEFCFYLDAQLFFFSFWNSPRICDAYTMWDSACALNYPSRLGHCETLSEKTSSLHLQRTDRWNNCLLVTPLNEFSTSVLFYGVYSSV